MKNALCLATCALSVLAFAVTVPAQSSGPAANGDFEFGIEGASGAIQFDARIQNDGTEAIQFGYEPA